MSEMRVEEEFTHEEVVEALLELVEQGVLEMGVNALTGESTWWFKEDPLGNASSEGSLAIA